MHGQFREGGGVHQRLFKVRPNQLPGKGMMPPFLLLGTTESDFGPGGIVEVKGANVDAILVQGAGAAIHVWSTMTEAIEPVRGFWESYLSVGRCALDPDHSSDFGALRFRQHDRSRKCLWCGSHQIQAADGLSRGNWLPVW